jgi:hypothetical protein
VVWNLQKLLGIVCSAEQSSWGLRGIDLVRETLAGDPTMMNFPAPSDSALLERQRQYRLRGKYAPIH